MTSGPGPNAGQRRTPPPPAGRTAQRLEWRFLPPHVRALIERQCAAPVLGAASQGGGYTPGFASVLRCADGSRHFVKAASVQAQGVIADSYREEARTLAALPADVPVAAWDHVRATRPGLPHLEQAATLAAGFAASTTGDTLVHTDLRDDNLILGPDGAVWMCDWNWPVRGAAWLDLVLLLLQPRGDGVDVEAVLATRALTRDVPAESVDSVLALLAGYFLRQGDEPVPSTSPYLRQHQRWCAEVTWDWLTRRRGWR